MLGQYLEHNVLSNNMAIGREEGAMLGLFVSA
jgi:hypothetical protein